MSGVLEKAQVFSRGEHVYIVAPLAVSRPQKSEIEQFAFAEALKAEAPNEHIMWLRGHYVEADRPNANGQMWTADDLALTHLSPRLMPVTIMHDPSTAVGLIADAKLSTPDADSVPRSRIDTSLAVWQHRFPEIAEECEHNFNEGTLMQSMECLPSYFECAECGRSVPNSAKIDPRPLMCEHLTGGNGEVAARILRDVVFTGTGLIFGTRGSRGAYDEAHLDVFQDEVAEFHTKSHQPQKKTRKLPRSKRTMEIENSEYAELQQRPTKEALAEEKARADEAEEAKATAERKAEEAEIAKKAAEDDRDEVKARLEEAEEAVNQEKLSKERVAKLGKGFLKKLPESIASKLEEQAKSMKDDEWTSRLEELSELVGVKTDEGLTREEEAEEEEREEFSAEEVAAAGLGKSPGSGNAPTPQAKAGVFGELFKSGSK